jgi:dimethylargininase
MFKHAIVRPPASTFAQGQTGVDLGTPDLPKALEQHAHYCAALEQCGLTLTHLPPDPEYPDSTFVEDPAVLTRHGAILTRPGAPTRAGEVKSIAAALRKVFPELQTINAPGTLDGGDICQVEDHFFIGISGRTNEEGARQLGVILAAQGFTSTTVDIRGVRGILHLKSGISYLGDRRISLIDVLAGHPAFHGYEVVHTIPEENYAANLLRINDYVIISAGHPKFEAAVRAFGYPVIALDMSEFEKMDGALSCLSLRF